MIHTEHELKTWEDFYEAIESGEKTFEVRRNDRGFQKGDVLKLKKYQRGGAYRTVGMEEMRVMVTYVLTGEDFGVKDGFCVMGIKPMPEKLVECKFDVARNLNVYPDKSPYEQKPQP